MLFDKYCSAFDFLHRELLFALIREKVFMTVADDVIDHVTLKLSKNVPGKNLIPILHRMLFDKKSLHKKRC